MSDESQNRLGTPTPEELREQVERTHDGLGRTVGTPAPEGDLRAQAKEKAAVVRDQAAAVGEQAAEKAAVASDQLREKAEQAARAVKDRTPEAVREKTAQAAAQVREKTGQARRYAADRTPDPLLEKADRAATAARANRAPLLAGGALLVAFLLIRRSRGRNR
ncbi:hypothetical protein [Streptomyces bacillaris]|uniref:hypothetical protein n=1 Tax=Streptomyces bacillaris TaxID=68179 RepID=UPI0037FF7C58